MPLRDVLRVLVVDDMSTSRGLMRQALDILGIACVSHAVDGPTAWAAIRHAPPDLVLSDLNMPGMSGLDLLRSIRSDDATRNCRFVLVTGSNPSETFRGMAFRGLDGVLCKPFTRAEVRECIESVVGRL